jgi:lysozyme
MMQLGAAGLALIQSFESCRLVSYQDQRGIWTIGYGHTGEDIGPEQACTQEQADQWLQDDTQSTVTVLLRDLDLPVAQNQFDALVSFLFNVGVTAGGHSTLLKLINQGQTVLAAQQFLLWNHVDGVVDPGLTRRRQAEQTLFLTPDA